MKSTPSGDIASAIRPPAKQYPRVHRLYEALRDRDHLLLRAGQRKTRTQTLVALRNKATSPVLSPPIKVSRPPRSRRTSLRSLPGSRLYLIQNRPRSTSRGRSIQGGAMSKLNASDIQGFALSGYNLHFARYLFLESLTPKKGACCSRACCRRHHRPALGAKARDHH